MKNVSRRRSQYLRTAALATALLCLAVLLATVRTQRYWPWHDHACESHDEAEGPTILFLGDSITEEASGPDGFITVLAATVAADSDSHNPRLINSGISGLKAPQLLDRLDREIACWKPDVAVVMIGINDVWHSLHREGTPKPDFVARMLEIVQHLRASGALVILATPTVLGESGAGIENLDPIVEDYATAIRRLETTSGVTLCDVRDAFVQHLLLNNPNGLNQGILTRDGVHLTKEGNQLVAETLASCLGSALPREFQHSKEQPVRSSKSA